MKGLDMAEDEARRGMQPWFPVVARALKLAGDEDYDGTRLAVRELVDQHGAEGLAAGMYAWADTALAVMGVDRTSRIGSSALVQVVDEDGTATLVEDPPAEVAWATGVLVARAQGRPNAIPKALGALADVMGDDPRGIERFLVSFVVVCAQSAQAVIRGETAVVAVPRPRQEPKGAQAHMTQMRGTS
jgi:hypothetical protein